jgi:hypothetical protein
MQPALIHLHLVLVYYSLNSGLGLVMIVTAKQLCCKSEIVLLAGAQASSGG